MSEETAKEVAPREPRKRRRFLKVLAALAVLVALIVLFLPYLMPTEWIASAAEKGLRSAFGRPTRLGKVSWGWLSGVRVEEVVVEEGEESFSLQSGRASPSHRSSWNRRTF
jgi:autotransporter translocation and assembly factor TamB